MTNDQIIELAKQVGFHSASVLHIYGGNADALCDSEIKELESIQRFAELVRNQTLEEAALKAVATLPFHPDLGEVCTEAIRGLKS